MLRELAEQPQKINQVEKGHGRYKPPKELTDRIDEDIQKILERNGNPMINLFIDLTDKTSNNADL